MNKNDNIIKSFGFLEIIKTTNKEKYKIEVRYYDRVIHDNLTMRTNLFFLFHSSLVLGSRTSIFYICDYFEHLTFDIIKYLENIVSEFNNDMDQKSILENEYCIWALYDIFSTIFDFFLSFYDTSKEQSGINNLILDSAKNSTLKQVNKIREKYTAKKNEVKCPYLEELNKLEFEEEREIEKVYGIDDNQIFNDLKKNLNIDDLFDNFHKSKEIYSYIDDFDIDLAIEYKIEPLIKNINKIAEIIGKFDFMIDTIQSHQPSMENILVCRLILEFPDFIKHYRTLRTNNIILVRESDHLFWDRSTVSLVEYFAFIYKKKLKSEKEQNKKQIQKNSQIPWENLESVFDKKNLKNFKDAAHNTKDFNEIRKLLNI